MFLFALLDLHLTSCSIPVHMYMQWCVMSVHTCKYNRVINIDNYDIELQKVSILREH